jgi:radical SAM superfamily enzyme YgiQ (UPF0313 family)
VAGLDILFVSPGDRQQVYQDLGAEFSAVEPPVFARLFAEHARRQGFGVAVLDIPAMNISAESAAEHVYQDYSPRLVVLPVYGFQPSASTQNMTAAGKVARVLKEYDPTLPVLMTGTHPAALPERTMREESVDFVIDMEGPATIVALATALREGSQDFSSIPSLWWRGADGTVHPPTAQEPLFRELDRDLPLGGWDLLDMSSYRAHNWHCFDHIEDRTPYASIYTSLGCPYKCSFCCINSPFGKPSYRMWSPEAVVAEIDHLVERYGVKNIKFVDEMFVLNKRHVLGICELLEDRSYDLNIWAYARVDTVRDEFLERLRSAGFRWLALGIEAANSTVRDGANKSFSDESIIETCDRIRSHGIYVLGNYIFGLPDDTLPRMQQTLDLALEINAEWANLYSAMAYPGSRLYDDALRNQWPLPTEWHGYSQHGYDAFPLPNPNLSSADILRFRDEAFQTYFRSPEYLLRIEQTFGPAVVEHIERMLRVPLPRRILEKDSAVSR